MIDGRARRRMQQWGPGLVVEATYGPGPSDEVPQWAAGLVGQRRRWVASSVLRSGPYAGQWAFVICAPRVLEQLDARDDGVPLEHLHALTNIGKFGHALHAVPQRPVRLELE